jgi:hypothetical protein
MRFLATLILLCCATGALAVDAKPTEASVKELFTLMHSSNIIDSYMTQIESVMRTSMQQATAGQPPNPQQQKILDDLQHKIVALVKEQLNWKDLEPTMIGVYRDTFSQAEIDGMLKFYRSEAGQAAITKIPVVMQESMARMQGRVNAMTPKIVELEKQAAAQLKGAASGAQPASPAAAPAPPAAQPRQ